MNIFPFRAAYPDLDLITSADSFFSSVRLDYPDIMSAGYYTTQKKDGFYVYQIKNSKSKYTGLLANINIEDYNKGYVLPHEKTLTAKEQEMMGLILKRKAMIKPVLLGYDDHDDISQMLNAYIKNKKPIFQTYFDLTGARHSFWLIRNEKLKNSLYRHFDHIKKVYIADGHHRCSTFSLFNLNKSKYDVSYNFNRLLSAFFPIHELNIFSYNRTIDLLNDMTYSQLIAKISKYVSIKAIADHREPKSPREMILVLPNETYSIVWKNSVLNCHNSNVLDTLLFNTYILKKSLGITNIRSDQRVKYVNGTESHEGLYNKIIKKERGVGFLLYPVNIQDFKRISNRHKVLPPKSTWFEPRLINGLITQSL